MSEELLSERFSHTGEPAIDINETQQEIIDQITEKIESGRYAFETNDCPVCGTQVFSTLAEQDRYGLYHPVVICRECGLIQAMPRMDERAYTEFYDTEYRLLYDGTEEWHEYQFDSQFERAHAIDDYLVDGSRQETGILDIGTGPGGMLDYFQQQGHPVAGCDLDESAVSYAQSRGVPVQRASVDKLDLYWEPSIIILSHIVEHFLDPIQDLRTIRDLGGSDTRYFVEVPGVKSVRPETSYYGSDFRKQLQNAHTYYFTIRSLRNTLQQAGLQPVDIGHAPALERDNEFGHIRAICVRNDEKPDAVVSDHSDVLTHLCTLEATTTD
jgi:2-polyprenyl-3-methyl-5-hydroxy-6-metoxy-1,4-benzoquinol methylase